MDMSHYPSSYYHPQDDQYFSTTSTTTRSRSSTPHRRPQELPSTPHYIPPQGQYETKTRFLTPGRQRESQFQRRVPPRRHYPSSDANPAHHGWNSTRPDSSSSFPRRQEYNQHLSTSHKIVPRYVDERSNYDLEKRRHAAYYSSPSPQTSEGSLKQLERLRQENRDDEIQLQLIRERESEIADINQKVNKVNEIYKDLAELINGQQDLIDQIDVSLEESNVYTQSGINNYEEARLRFENPILEDPFGDKLGSHSKYAQAGSLGDQEGRRRRIRGAPRNAVKVPRNDDEQQFDCTVPFETIQDDLKEVLRDVKSLGSKIVLACTAPNVQYYNEYTTYR